MSMIPSYGGDPSATGAALMEAMLRQAASTSEANAATKNAMLEAQTSDLDRRGQGLISMIENAPELASVTGWPVIMAAVQRGYDPSRGVGLSPEAMDYTASYATEADRHRLTNDYAEGFEKLAGGAADFVSNAGLLPDMGAAWQRQPTSFRNVPRDSEIGASAAFAIADAARRDEDVTSIVGPNNEVLFSSQDPEQARTHLINMLDRRGNEILSNGMTIRDAYNRGLIREQVGTIFRDNQIAPHGQPIPEAQPTRRATPLPEPAPLPQGPSIDDMRRFLGQLEAGNE